MHYARWIALLWLRIHAEHTYLKILTILSEIRAIKNLALKIDY